MAPIRRRTIRWGTALIARSAPAVVVVVIASCAQVLGLDDSETLRKDCETNADCADPCQISGCSQGVCLRVPHTGQPLIAFSDDGCVASTCKDGELVKEVKPAGAPCGTEGTSLTCLADGTCAGCAKDSDCPIPDITLIDDIPTLCRAPSCAPDGTCGQKPAPAGEALVDDVVGDCSHVFCDGEHFGPAGLLYLPSDAPVPTGDPSIDACLGECSEILQGFFPYDGVSCPTPSGADGFCCGGVCIDMNEGCASAQQ